MLLSSKTLNQVRSLNLTSNQPIIISGPEFTYKELLSKKIASQSLEIDIDKLDSYPYIITVISDKKSLGIEEIRDLSKFISLTVPLNKAINRVVMIPNSEILTVQAQNALLKNLEESPKSTLFILTTKKINNILPTILSRSRIIDVVKPSKIEIKKYLNKHNDTEIEQNYLLSDGAPRLIEILLDNNESDIKNDVDLTKKILSASKINKLSYINELSKSREESIKIISLIKQMSKLGCLSNKSKQSIIWQNILDRSMQAEKKLRSNSSVKLTLLDFFLNI
jgi:DNA polymerase-3 subunit delta'